MPEVPLKADGSIRLRRRPRRDQRHAPSWSPSSAARATPPARRFSVRQIGELIAFVKSIRADIICMVDNCYGEFVETIEPSDVGADMIVGSLIKNPGRRSGAHRRLYLRHEGLRGSLRLSPLRARSGSGGRREPRPDDRAVSGLLPRADGRLRRAQGRDFRREYLRKAWLPRRAQFHRVPPRHHSGRRAGQRGGA